MGNSGSSSTQKLPDLPQDIIVSNLISPTDDFFEPKTTPQIKQIKLTKKEYKIPISIYSKTLRLTLNDKSIYIYFKYKANLPSFVRLYLGVRSSYNELPRLQCPLYESPLDVESDEFSSQGIRLGDKYESVFYTRDTNYVPIAITFGDLIYSGFVANSTFANTKRNFMVKDKTLYPVQEVYGVDNSNSNLCVICYTNTKSVIITPCFHCCVCSECSKQLTIKDQRCPLCRTTIMDLVSLVSN